MQRAFRLMFGLAVAAMASSSNAAESTFPDRPLRLIVPYPPGGNTDILARVVAQRMTDSLAKPVVVDNRGGGNGVIASEISARSSPDGHTIFVGSTRELSINPALMRALPYDAIKDFAPISQGTITAILIGVHPSLPVRSIKELIAYARSDPKFAYGTPGIGTAMHLSGELLNIAARVNTVHVPYKGGGPAVAAVLAGQEVKLGYMGMGPVIPHVKAGKIRPLAITLGKRSALLPEIPTMRELGYKEFETSMWFGFFVPTQTPKGTVGKLNGEIVRILNSKEVNDYLVNTGVDVAPSTPAELSRFVRDDFARYAKIIREAKIEPQ
ncbi:MAG: tripartite tricarboxylate transporter substrate binding protein [Burkholderiales bacterium]|nr:tripartite tricarboxylate transporter substrate binding protein [Burkholderiales bacterium]